MKIFIPLLAVIILTASCSSNPSSFFRSPSAIKSHIKSLEGKTIEEAIDILGLPVSEDLIAGKTILTWADSGTAKALTGTAYTTGSGAVYIFAQTRQFYCVVRGVVDGNLIQFIEIKANSVYYCPGH